MISRKPSNTSVVDLLRAVDKMITEIQASAFKVANQSFINKIRQHSTKVDSIGESRDQIDGVCFENIAGGFMVYNWNDKRSESQYLMFDDTKQRNILDKILSFFGRKIVKPLNFGCHYGRYHISGHYVEREEFMDYVKEEYPDVFCWILFNHEII